MPALRFVASSSAEKLIEEVSARPKIGIRPFQRTKRRVLIDRLLYDPKVQAAARGAGDLPCAPWLCRHGRPGEGQSRSCENGQSGRRDGDFPVPLSQPAPARASGRSLSVLELKSHIERILDDLDPAGAHVYVPRKDLDYALDVGLRMLRMRHLVDEYEGLFSARLEELPVLRYYANSIAHLLPA